MVGIASEIDEQTGGVALPTACVTVRVFYCEILHPTSLAMVMTTKSKLHNVVTRGVWLFHPILEHNLNSSLHSAAKLNQISQDRPGVLLPPKTRRLVASTLRIPATPRRGEDPLEGIC